MFKMIVKRAFLNRAMALGPVVQSGVSSSHSFSFCISTLLFASKPQKPKLLLVQTIFLKKYFHLYKEAAGQLPLNLR